eukprot:4727103-Amphidinium_carterae.1
MGGSASRDREKNRHLAAVKRDGRDLREVPEHYKANREVVLAAVQQSGSALEYAAAECKGDHTIVLEAVK